MSLRLWLPLNGNLNNYGLDSCSVTNNGATINSSGKIGSCYYFDGTDDYINTGYIPKFGTGDFTISLWLKLPTTTSGSYKTIISSKTASGASLGCGIYWNISQKKFLWSTANGTTSQEIWMANQVDSLVYDEWIHLVMVRNSSDSKIGYFYINGVRYELNSVPSILNITDDTPLYIGKLSDNYYPANIYVNDVRIYDHALSVKEVKEISKGLVLHYKLDNNGFGNPNILKDMSNFGLYGSDYSSVSTRTLGKIEVTSSGNFNAYNWCQGYMNPTVVNNTKTYTISLDVKTTNLTSDMDVRFTIDFRRDDHSHLVLGRVILNPLYNNTWHRYYATITGTAEDQTRCLLGFNNAGSGTNCEGLIIEYKNFKLEEGLVATPWCPNSSDTLYTTLGLNNTTKIKDYSGYNNDGVIIGTVTSSSDTVRYSSSSFIQSSDTTTQSGASYIKGTFINNIVPTNLTVNWWSNMNTWNYQNSGILSFSLESSNPSDYNTGTINQYDSIFRFNNSSTYTSFSATNFIVNNAWHMYSITYDGTNIKSYRDGVNINTVAISSLSNFKYIYLGLSTAGSAWRSTIGKWSDFRIYSTALSADDILQLYKSSASIDKNGNLYAYELVEE